MSLLTRLARLQVRYEVAVRDERREAARREDIAAAGGPVPPDHPALAASAPHSAPPHPDQRDRRVVPLTPVPRRRAQVQGLEDDIPS